MRRYIGKRLLISIGTLFVVILILFTLLQYMPGSPFNDEKLTQDQRAVLYEKYGLDQPVVVQFFKYVVNMLKGDFGVSYTISKNTQISQLLQSRLPVSPASDASALHFASAPGTPPKSPWNRW